MCIRDSFTGASARNWAGYGEHVRLPAGFSDTDRMLLTDPQTSGGLLAACSAQSLDEVQDTFRRHGFDAVDCGEVLAPAAAAEVLIA